MKEYFYIYTKAVIWPKSFFREEKIESRDSLELLFIATFMWCVMMPFLPYGEVILPMVKG